VEIAIQVEQCSCFVFSTYRRTVMCQCATTMSTFGAAFHRSASTVVLCAMASLTAVKTISQTRLAALVRISIILYLFIEGFAISVSLA